MNTKIEWATETWNPVTGCTPVSEACQNCYAKRMANRLRGRFGYPEDEPFKVALHPEKLDEPLRWKKPRRVFVCSMSDLFHEEVPFIVIAKIFGIMHTANQHTYIVLTKRPERMAEFIKWFTGPSWRGAWPQEYPHVWLGVTAENQARFDERVDILKQIPAAVHFVSIEPMLGPIVMRQKANDEREIIQATMMGVLDDYSRPVMHGIDWVICGGETGPGARPMHPDWVRSLRDQCQEAGTPFFFKQWGDWAPIPTKDVPVIGCADGGRFHDGPNPSRGLAMYRVGNKAAGYLIDGQEWRQFPEVIKEGRA